MKSSYDEARSDLRDVSRELKKDVREEAREAYRVVKESADQRIDEINDNFRATRDMERSLNDDCSRENIREARKAAREAKDDINLEVSMARDAIDNEEADFREDVADMRRDARDDTFGATVYDHAEHMVDEALRTENFIDEDMLDSLDSMDDIVNEPR